MKEQSLETTSITDRRVRRKKTVINPLPLTRRLSKPYEIQLLTKTHQLDFLLKKPRN